ncbi:hypothetical protein ABEB36_010264 [Hypothenemus hampei]|uniref:Uncharacterized protein n=1 Tax=Hypothenemus hampei TaxID=57062 RepID=A0ABD1EJM8_HYPHA
MNVIKQSISVKHYFLLQLLLLGYYIESDVTALDCLVCNRSAPSLDKDPCNGVCFIRECPENNVCLSAKYEIISVSDGTNATINMETCYPYMKGDECNHFFHSQSHLHGSKKLMLSNCYSCYSDTCNVKNTNDVMDYSGNTGFVAISFSIATLIILNVKF